MKRILTCSQLVPGGVGKRYSGTSIFHWRIRCSRIGSKISFAGRSPFSFMPSVPIPSSSATWRPCRSRSTSWTVSGTARLVGVNKTTGPASRAISSATGSARSARGRGSHRQHGKAAITDDQMLSDAVRAEMVCCRRTAFEVEDSSQRRRQLRRSSSQTTTSSIVRDRGSHRLGRSPQTATIRPSS